MSEIEKPIFFIKIDAETYEDKIIRGMKNTIKKYQPLILLEFNNIVQQEEIYHFVNVIYPYSVCYWNDKSQKFERKNRKGSINYFLVPKSFMLKDRN